MHSFPMYIAFPPNIRFRITSILDVMLYCIPHVILHSPKRQISHNTHLKCVNPVHNGSNMDECQLLPLQYLSWRYIWKLNVTHVHSVHKTLVMLPCTFFSCFEKICRGFFGECWKLIVVGCVEDNSFESGPVDDTNDTDLEPIQVDAEYF